MKKVAVVTATRAEYGLLNPLIRRIQEDDILELDLIATGTHLSNKHGYTIDEIRNDGFSVAHEIDILEDDNTAYGIAHTMANATKRFAECFRDDRPDMLVILGDRTEMLGVASAALIDRIPIAHIHGGEVTEGAVDDCVRHAITKMSYLHFTATEEYRRRVMQLGERPDRVFNVGALGVENILNMEFLSEEDVRNDIGIPTGMPYALSTYHPVTLSEKPIERQIGSLCEAMDARKDIFFLMTGSNADAGGDKTNVMLKEYGERHSNAKYVHSLGRTRYLNALKYADFVLGNSSSGILEAPALGTPTVNIGDRQKGRIMAETVITCGDESYAIIKGIECALKTRHISSRIYGDGTASRQIVAIIKQHLLGRIDFKKSFYDVVGIL